MSQYFSVVSPKRYEIPESTNYESQRPFIFIDVEPIPSWATIYNCNLSYLYPENFMPKGSVTLRINHKERLLKWADNLEKKSV